MEMGNWASKWLDENDSYANDWKQNKGIIR